MIIGRSAGAAIGLALCLAGPAFPAPLKVAVADLDYIDTSGEVRDQKAAHAAEMARFVQSLRGDLARGGGYRVVALDCRDACSGFEADPSKLIATAKDQGADILIFGGIHKMSTLIQYMNVQGIDLSAGKVVLSRLLTFRGDDDEAWRRAEEFLARDIDEHPLSRQD
jgi:hypothetical protein